MKKIYLLLLLFKITTSFSACPTTEVSIISQTQMDGFRALYTNCTVFNMNVRVDGESITNLNGLSDMTSIGADLTILRTSITDLTGLENLVSVTGSIRLIDNSLMTSLSGLGNLTSAGGLTISQPITSLHGLTSLTNLSGLGLDNTKVSDLSGLENVTGLRGLSFVGNSLLENIDALDNLNPDVSPYSPYVNIVSNPLLTDCISSFICEAVLPKPGASPSIIENNGIGCKTRLEVFSKCEEEGVLPVKLISFEAKKSSESTALLTWATSEESNSRNFEIQKSTQGITWIPLGTLNAQGESSTTVQYLFTDKNPVEGNNFYRLKMVDLDGTFSYSAIINVSFHGLPRAGIYPNPAFENFQFKSDDLKNIVRVQIHNQEGKVIHQATSIASDGVDVKQFPSGLYTISIEKADGNITQYKMVKK
jgi:hypothetical protein